MATTLEKQTVKGHIADICDSIPASDVSTFADELLQAELVGEAGHKEAIDLTGSSSRNKVSKLMTEVITRVAGSQDKFAKLVSILESRNEKLAEILRSAYQGLASCSETESITPRRQHGAGHERRKTDPSPAPKRLKRQDSFADQYVTQLRQVYRAPPPIWDPLPQCKHIRLVMIKEKGRQYVGADKEIVASKVEGKVADILKVKKSVDMDAIFDDGIFDKKGCQVILVEAGPGMGKTSLAYYYSQKWAKDELKAFGAVAFVRLRDLCVREDDTQPLHTLSSLLFLASGNRIEMSEELCHLLVTNLKFLLVLDGWDELPGSFSKSDFFRALLTSVSPQTVILITSRPESSLHLHGQANRVSIIGFKEKDIDEYFRNAFQSELDDVDSACAKLSDHFSHYPVIKSCCYVPLNAAILAFVYIGLHSCGQPLPKTRCELFCKLVVCCIRHELETRKLVEVDPVSSFEDLPTELGKQLHNLCRLAFDEGVKKNKIVFSQKDLTSFKLPKDHPTLGLLQSVEGYGLDGSRQITYNFIHLAVQELLAAYYISKMGSDKQATEFTSLLKDSRSSAVLQFYSAFSQLANKDIQETIACYGIFNSEYDDHEKSLGCKKKTLFLTNARVSILNCFFEAQLRDESFYSEFLENQKSQAISSVFDSITLSPLDCISLFYFLSSTRAVTKGNVRVNLYNCYTDSHSQAVLLGKFPEHGESSVTARVLDCVTEWRMNGITDTGLACIGTTLTTNSTLKVLTLGREFLFPKVTDEGLINFLEALENNRSLESLSIEWLSTCPGQSLKKMQESVAKSSLKQLNMRIASPWLRTERTINNWLYSLQVKAGDLIQCLECHQLQHLRLDVWCICYRSLENELDTVPNSVEHYLDAQVKLVNSKRQAKGFLPITLATDDQHNKMFSVSVDFFLDSIRPTSSE